MFEHLEKKAKELKIETRAFIDGKFINTVEKNKHIKISPIKSEKIPAITLCSSTEVDLAVKAARNSFTSKIWLNKSVSEKKEILYNLSELLENNKEELALLDTLETGRAFKNFYNDSIPKAISCLKYFIEAIDKYYGHISSSSIDSYTTITNEPLGVIGLITPWNDPLVVSMWKIAPSLLMGNSVVLKPAEQSTYSILKVAKLATQAGIPHGVINIIPGTGEITGKALAEHSDVNAIFFTGSSNVGKKILTYSGNSNMKKVGLECGGKSPFIVSENCKNIKKAAEVLANNIFYNQGQICSAPSRAIISNSIKNEFIELLKIETKKYIPKDPFNPASEVGYLISKEQKERIEKYIQSAYNINGIEFYTPKIDETLLPKGEYIIPIIFDLPNNHCSIAKEEIFGPVLVIIGFDEIEDALFIANNTKYGLASSIWSDDLNEAHRISKELQSGIVHVNCYGEDDNSVPFGGIKESGFGKDKSIFSFNEYSYSKTTWFNIKSFEK